MQRRSILVGFGDNGRSDVFRVGIVRAYAGSRIDARRGRRIRRERMDGDKPKRYQRNGFDQRGNRR